MKRYTAAAALLLFTSCCCPPKVINVDAIDDLTYNVTERHDTYVQDDPALTEAQKQTYLDSSALLRKVVEEAKKQ